MRVFYNPDDPWEAALETGENRCGTIFMIVLASLFALIGFIVTVIEVLVLLARR